MPEPASGPSKESFSRRRSCRWENGGNSCACCARSNCWRQEKRSVTPHWKRATAHRAPLWQCSEKHWERHRAGISRTHCKPLRGTLRLRVTEVDHHRGGAEPPRLVADIEDPDREPDAAHGLGDDVQV